MPPVLGFLLRGGGSSRGRGQLRAGGLEPTAEFLIELRSQLSPLKGEVARFAEVFGQVKKLDGIVVVAADQFMLPRANGAGRPVGAVEGVMGIVEEERRAAFGFALEHRTQRGAVERFVGSQFYLGGIKNGGGQVHGDYGRGVGGGGFFHDARPADDEGHAQAAFVEIAFAGAQRTVVGGTFPAAVVAGENDQRLVRDAESVNFVEHPADRAVGGLDLRGVDFVPDAGAALALVFGNEFFRGLERVVDVVGP